MLRIPKPLPETVRRRSLRGNLALPAAAGLALSLAACAWFSSSPPPPPIEPVWRLVPEATVLGERRQFFMYGKHLDSVTVTVPPSLVMEQGEAGSKGRVRSFHFKVSPLSGDSLAQGEEVGIREVRVKTPDTSLVFRIKVIDEAHPR